MLVINPNLKVVEPAPRLKVETPESKSPAVNQENQGSRQEQKRLILLHSTFFL